MNQNALTSAKQLPDQNSEYAKYLASPMLKARMNKSLDQCYLVDGKAISGRQLLTDKVNDGWVVEQIEVLDHNKNKKLQKEYEDLQSGEKFDYTGGRMAELRAMMVFPEGGYGEFKQAVIKPILKDPNSDFQIELSKFELAFVKHLLSSQLSIT